MLTITPLRPWHTRFCWRLDRLAGVRGVAGDSRRPTIFGHVRFMLRHLMLKTHRAWVLGYDGEPAGLVRIERRGHQAVVSIAVLPEHRGKGVAMGGVTAASAWAVRNWKVGGWPDVPVQPTAYIRSDNGASVALFSKCGFDLVQEEGGWVTMQQRNLSWWPPGHPA